MVNPGSERLLTLVQHALDEIDERPIAVTARRVARIASLLGDTEFAVYLGYELRALGGHPPANAEDTRRLMTDPSLWADRDGPQEAAFTRYAKSRAMEGADNGKVFVHGLAEIEELLLTFADTAHSPQGGDLANFVQFLRGIRERVRHTAFTALCSWERQLTYANVNERIFERFRSRVDSVLAKGAPDVLDQFAAVYRRIREATSDQDAPMSEELSQAVTTCRRILKAVADHLLPGVAGATSQSGNSLNDAAYRNRIYEFVKAKVASDSTAELINAAVGGVYARFTALDTLANKGVHADLGVQEAELCAISTYLIAGELLTLGESARPSIETLA